MIDVDSGAVVQEMRFDEWGVLLEDTNPWWQPFGFTGGLWDADTGLVRFGEMSWAIPLRPRRDFDVHAALQSLNSNDVRKQIDATARLRREDINDEVERLIAGEVAKLHSPHVLLNLASVLRFGRIAVSIEALRSVFHAHLGAAVEVAAQAAMSLFLRNSKEELRSLQAASVAMPIEAVASVLRIASIETGIPSTGWPRPVIDRLATSGIPNGDLWAAHLLLRRGLRKGLDICSKRLEHGGVFERLSTISALQEGRAGSHRLLRALAAHDPDPWIRLTASRAAQLPKKKISELVRDLSASPNPYYRWVAVDFIDSLGRDRAEHVESWFAKEVDPVVREKLEAKRGRR